MNRMCVLIVLIAVAGPSLALAVVDQPNIVLIFADDLGWNGVSYAGSDFYETPNIDRLAREGMIFENGYAGAGNCQPSRACLLSGQYTPGHGVYAVGSTKRGPEHLMRMVPVPNVGEIPKNNATIAEVLASAGYATGGFGKWHAGGRERFQTTMARDKKAKRDKASDPKNISSITRAACNFMEENKDGPFFAYISHHAIHTPIEGRPATIRKFTDKKPGEQHNAPKYAACIYDLDDGVRLILEKLDELNLMEKALVVFTSDNGGTPASSQEPLRGAKGSYYEAGIREPFVVRWPGVVQPGSRCEVPVISQDLFPTFLEAAGVKPPPSKLLDGESLLPLLKGGKDLNRKAIFWHFPGYLNTAVPRGRDPDFRTRPVTVMRKGDWKLHLYHEEWLLDGGREKLETNKALELYNLSDDVGERDNLALKHQGKRDELLDEALSWIETINAPLPQERNPTYDPSKRIEKRKKTRKQGRS